MLPLSFYFSTATSGYKSGCRLLLLPTKQPKVDIGKVDILSIYLYAQGV